MSNADDGHNDRLIQIRLLEQLDHLIRDIRRTVSDGEARAKSGDPDAFASLRAFLDELLSLVENDRSANVANLDTDVADRVSGAAALALSTLNSDELMSALRTSMEAIGEWQPPQQNRDERPNLVLGDATEVVAAWHEESTNENQREDRVLELRQRLLIINSAQCVLAALDRHRTHLRNRASGERSDESDGSTTAEPRRPWTRQELDETIRQRRVHESTNIDRLRRLIQSGDTNALRQTQQQYGRNAFERELNAPRSMISNSAAWHELADYLGIPRGPHGGSARRIGYDIAIEEASQRQFTADDRDLCRLVNQFRERAPAAVFDSLVEQFQAGDLTADQVREAIAPYFDLPNEDAERDRSSGGHDL